MLDSLLLSILLVFNQILNAGNAITAFSLLLYTLTFNMRERVARSFAILLACVAAAYFGDVLASLASAPQDIELWMRFQWLGIAFLPASFLHLSDALLEATGRPSRGRRRFVVQLSYFLGGASFAGAVLTPELAGPLNQIASIHYLRPGSLFPLFSLFLLASLGIAAVNFWRAYQRCLTKASRRRMTYLMAGSVGPVLGTFPFLMFVGSALSEYPLLVWLALVPINATVAALLVLMAYSVAYFGVTQPDRVVKSRLFQWILRGPVVASTVLAATVIVNRFSQLVGLQNSLLVPFTMVASLLLLEYLINLVRPVVERWLFYGEDRDDILRLHLLEERLLTTGDLRQYLESVLNAVCDITHSSASFVALIGPEGLELEVGVGPHNPLRGSEELPAFVMDDQNHDVEGLGKVFRWGRYWLIPLHSPESRDLTGLLGIYAEDAEPSFSTSEIAALDLLARRAAIALTDRLLQREIFGVVDRLVPQVEAIQQMRAVARYKGSNAFTMPLEGMHTEADLPNLVKEALGHYWGGPRLAASPLLRLRVVREALDEYEGNPINSLRHILRRGIDRVRPEGERRFTAEWMLYNILEMKFLQGRKVRDVAMRLAMSEADLYRKQRVAIEMVAQAIAEMEREAAARAFDEKEAVA